MISRELSGSKNGLWLRVMPVFWSRAPGYPLWPFLRDSSIWRAPGWLSIWLSCVLAQGFLPSLLVPSPLICCLLGRPRSLAYFCNLCHILVYSALGSQADQIPGCWQAPGIGTFSVPLGCALTLPRSVQSAVVVMFSFMSTYCVLGPPAVDEARMSSVH